MRRVYRVVPYEDIYSARIFDNDLRHRFGNANVTWKVEDEEYNVWYVDVTSASDSDMSWILRHNDIKNVLSLPVQ